MPFWLQIACATLCCTAVASAPVEPVEHGSGVGVINIVGDALSETHNWEKGFGKKRKKREVNPCDDNGCTPTIIGSDSVWAYDADTSDEFEFDSVGDFTSLKWKQEIGGWEGAFIRVNLLVLVDGRSEMYGYFVFFPPILSHACSHCTCTCNPPASLRHIFAIHTKHK